jgi:hypothetical protein
MGEFEKELDAEGNTWSLILGVPTITIAGPKGTCDTVKLMGRGKPVEGAGDFNGVRVVVVDRVLEETTGILAQKLPVPEEPKSAPAQGKKQSGD